MKSFTFEAIGTRWVIEIFDDLPETEYASLETQIHEQIEAFDKTYSRFRQDSLVTQMAHQAGEYLLPEEGGEMLRLYDQLYHLTDGRLTPLIGSVLVEAGYDELYSLKPKKLHQVKKWEDVLVLSKKKVLVKEPALLDFGALGKGKLIDIIAGLLEKKNIATFCIDAGGDIRYQGKKPLRVGLEHPEHPDQVLGVVKIKNHSIAASAGNRRKWGSYHHIINPQTLASEHRVLATWVIAENAMLADALATALFFTDPAVFTEHFSFSSLVLKPDFSVVQTGDFPAELYYT